MTDLLTSYYDRLLLDSIRNGSSIGGHRCCHCEEISERQRTFSSKTTDDSAAWTAASMMNMFISTGGFGSLW